MSAGERYRDSLRRWVPWWLSDRKYSSGKTVGYRVIWVMVAMLDAIADWIVAGLTAAWPGKGTPTALPLISRSRGVVRGQSDTNEEFAAKLRGWLERAASLGSARAIAREVHEYLSSHPRVRVITRSGHWATMAADGTVTTDSATWDWDSTSNPERAGYWSELWVIVYTSQFSPSGTWGDGRLWGRRDSGLGHVVSRVDRDALLGLLATSRSAHSKIRAVIWTTDNALFDPTVPSSCPNGTWGQWSLPGSDPRVPGGRITTTCRYWEPE